MTLIRNVQNYVHAHTRNSIENLNQNETSKLKTGSKSNTKLIGCFILCFVLQFLKAHSELNQKDEVRKYCTNNLWMLQFYLIYLIYKMEKACKLYKLAVKIIEKSTLNSPNAEK